jgi:hypothetical protein
MSASAFPEGAAPRAPGRHTPAPHDRADAGEVLRTVRAMLLDDVVPATDGMVSYHARIAARLIGMVERELQQGPADAERHAADLRELGYPDDRALAAAIRAGELDGRGPELRAALRTAARARLEVANPRHLGS